MIDYYHYQKLHLYRQGKLIHIYSNLCLVRISLVQQLFLKNENFESLKLATKKVHEKTRHRKHNQTFIIYLPKFIHLLHYAATPGAW